MDGQNFQNNNYQDYTANVQTTQSVTEPEQKQSNGMAIVSLVLGITAIVFSCCCGIGFVLGIAGIICAVVANKRNKSGLGLAGLICSIIGTVFGLFGLVYWIYCFALAGSMTTEESMRILEEAGFYY